VLRASTRHPHLELTDEVWREKVSDSLVRVAWDPKDRCLNIDDF